MKAARVVGEVNEFHIPHALFPHGPCIFKKFKLAH